MTEYQYPAPSGHSWSVAGPQPETYRTPAINVVNYHTKYTCDGTSLEIELEFTHELPPNANTIIRFGRTPLRTVLSYSRDRRPEVPLHGLLSAMVPPQAVKLSPSGVDVAIEVIESNVPIEHIPVGYFMPFDKRTRSSL